MRFDIKSSNENGRVEMEWAIGSMLPSYHCGRARNPEIDLYPRSLPSSFC